MLPVVAVCAAAGIITSTIAKTGLGLQLSSVLVGAARAVTDNPTGTLIATVVFAAVAVDLSRRKRRPRRRGSPAH